MIKDFKRYWKYLEMLDYYVLIKKINGILLKYHKVKNSFVGIFPFFFFFSIPILATQFFSY